MYSLYSAFIVIMRLVLQVHALVGSGVALLAPSWEAPSWREDAEPPVLPSVPSATAAACCVACRNETIKKSRCSVLHPRRLLHMQKQRQSQRARPSGQSQQWQRSHPEGPSLWFQTEGPSLWVQTEGPYLPLVPAASVALLRPSICELSRGGVVGRFCAAGHDWPHCCQSGMGAHDARTALMYCLDRPRHGSRPQDGCS